jgi:putative RNA 2'-phosphotransferase
MIQVGMRHGKPVLLSIDAKRLLADGREFFATGNHVWLTDHVPPEYLTAVPA